MSKLKKIEREKGKPMKQILQELWIKHGSQQKIADELDATQGTISLWFMRSGLKIVETKALVETEPA